MAGFCLASEIGPSPSEREVYEATIRSQAEQLQEARNASQSGGMKPEEKQALVRLLSDLSRKIEDLEKSNKSMQKEVYDLRELTKRTLKAHWARMDDLVDESDGRLSALEGKAQAQNTDVAKAHIDTLAHELLTRAKAGQRGVTYAEAAKILSIGKSRVCQLRTLIASDSRFNISWHPNRKNMKIICLKKFSPKEIVELNVQLGAENQTE